MKRSGSTTARWISPLAISSPSRSLTVTWQTRRRPSLIGSAHRTVSSEPTALPLTCSILTIVPTVVWSGSMFCWQTWKAAFSHHVIRRGVARTSRSPLPTRTEVSSAVTVCWNLRMGIGRVWQRTGRLPIRLHTCLTRAACRRAEPEPRLGIWPRDHPPVGHQRGARRDGADQLGLGAARRVRRGADHQTARRAAPDGPRVVTSLGGPDAGRAAAAAGGRRARLLPRRGRRAAPVDRDPLPRRGRRLPRRPPRLRVGDPADTRGRGLPVAAAGGRAG